MLDEQPSVVIIHNLSGVSVAQLNKGEAFIRSLIDNLTTSYQKRA